MRKPNRRFAPCATSIRWSATSLSVGGVACVKSRKNSNTYAKFCYKGAPKAVLAADKKRCKMTYLVVWRFAVRQFERSPATPRLPFAAQLQIFAKTCQTSVCVVKLRYESLCYQRPAPQHGLPQADERVRHTVGQLF